MVPLQHQHLAVDGVHHLLIEHHLAEDLRLDAGLLGQSHHLHHRADVAAGEAGVVAIGELAHARLGKGKQWRQGTSAGLAMGNASAGDVLGAALDSTRPRQGCAETKGGITRTASKLRCHHTVSFGSISRGHSHISRNSGRACNIARAFITYY